MITEQDLLIQFKRTDWDYNYAEGNAYYSGLESYQKTMRMVHALGERGEELLKEYLDGFKK